MRSAAGLLAFLAAILLPRPAFACSCMNPGPACQSFWTVDAVFEATVLSIAPLARTEMLGEREVVFTDKLVTLQVHRTWKGPQPEQLPVTTARDGAACRYPFEVGKRYLVFAHVRPGTGLAVSSCGGTKLSADALEEMRFLGSLAAPPPGGRVFGTVQTSHRVLDHNPSVGNLPTETVVRLTGSGRDVSVKSAGGRYEFTGLDDGPYRVQVEVPAGYTTYGAARDVRLVNRHSCAEVNYWFSSAGRVVGWVVGANGKAVKDVRVEITGADTKPHRDWGLPMESDSTDPDGFFQFGGLSPGRYIVGLNLKDLPSQYNPYARTVYPGLGFDPHVIEIALGQTADLGVWQIPPPLPIVRVEGVVVRPDGTAVRDVYVGAWDETGNPVERARGAGGATTGRDGRFVLELRKGRIYEFTVRDRQSTFLRIDAPRLDTSAEIVVPLRLVLTDQWKEEARGAVAACPAPDACCWRSWRWSPAGRSRMASAARRCTAASSAAVVGAAIWAGEDRSCFWAGWCASLPRR